MSSFNNLYSSEDAHTWKIGLVGESGVGKSCLLIRYCNNAFFEEADKYTIGVDFMYKNLQIKDANVKLQIHDTAGQERFRTVTASFYRGANGVLLVFDVSNLESFSKLPVWLEEVRNYTSDKTPIVMVGNKIDLEQRRMVSKEMAQKFADSAKILYFETSAKDSIGIDIIFTSLTEQIAEIK